MKKLSLLFLTVMLGMGAFAQTTYSWRSEATNGNWNDANNWWNGSTAVPTGGEILSFGNNNQLTMTNDLAATNRYQIIFTSYATQSRKISGTTENTFNNYNNDVNKKPKIENNSSATQTIDFPLKAGADFELNPISGDLIISGTYNRNGKTTKVYTNTTTPKTLYVKNSFTGSGDIYLLNGSTMNIDNGGSITGGTVYVENGTLTFAGTGNLSTSTDVRISASKVMNLNNVNVNVKSVAERASNNSGTINLGSGTLTLEGGWSQTIYQNSIIGTGSLIKKGTGIIALFGTQSYAGTTTIEGGTVATIVSMSSSTITVKSGASFDVNENITINNLIVESGGTLNIAAGKTLTINAGKQVTINGTVNNNSTGKIKLLSDVNGTATLMGNYSGPAEVQQYLTGDGRSWWYLASPVSSATSNVIAPTGSSNKIGEYFENYIESPNDDTSTTAPYYSLPFTAGSAKALTVGKGYVIKFSDTNAKTVTFTGGSLNTGDVSPSVTRTGTTAAKRGFNLVGNPYPSYLDWNLVFDAATATNMRNAIWFRTMGTSAMTFQTYSDGEGVPDNASSIIAPMQAFWVKVATDGNNGSLTFKNTHRSHFVTGANPLKVKALDARPRLRLVVSNGTATDEMLVVGKSYASDVLDSYDIEKMSNDNVAIPEVYSVVSNQELVINSMNALTEGKTVTLGFRPGQTGTNFTIEATQLENIDAKVMLLDKVAGTEQELTAGTPYSFTVTDAAATTDRFVISFAAKVPTGIETGSASGDMTVYTNRNNRIQVIYRGELNDQTTVSVYNVAGQMLSTQKLVKASTELSGTFHPGVYMIQLNNGKQTITGKLIIR